MFIINKSMQQKMENLNINAAVMNKELSTILEEGFICVDGCFLLKYFQKNNTHVNLKDFHDKTAYECFINSFHVNDYVDRDHLLQGILFLNAILTLWANVYASKKLNVLIVCDQDDVVIKNFLKREDENYLVNDVDSYSESIMLTDTVINFNGRS